MDLFDRIRARRFESASVSSARRAAIGLILVACGSAGNDAPPSRLSSSSAGSSTNSADVHAEAGASSSADASPIDATSPDESSTSTVEAGSHEAGPLPPDPCIEAGTCPPGTWIDVTPSALNLTTPPLDCGTNYGGKSIQLDPASPSDMYAPFECQGIWRSTDYGLTWNGPINTGMNGNMLTDCGGQISIPQNGQTSPPTIYCTCITGTGEGFWRSTNGGVDWQQFNVTTSPSFQEFYPPAIDPYDANHLLMVTHTMDEISESTDGGQTWSAVQMASGMISGNGGTGGIYFVNTGSADTTGVTWLWSAAASGGTIGTWRTTNSGQTWTQVDKGEHATGATQFFYQPDTSGVLYMAGIYSALGWGVTRSTDYGQTWTHVGLNDQEATIFATPDNIYAMYGWAAGPGVMVSPLLEVGATPGTGTWTMPATPAAMTQGPGQAAVTSDGVHEIIVITAYNAGLWRYVEP